MAAGDDARRIDGSQSGNDPDPSIADGSTPAAGEPTLAELRLRIQALASTDGRFVVACARTGESPVPIHGYRFASRRDAAEAAGYATEYRARLRKMDPRTPHYDPIVHESVRRQRGTAT